MSCTVPINPSRGVTVRVKTAECPMEMVSEGGEAEILKSVTWNICETFVAAAYWVLPGCEACMVHVPAATMVATATETVQTEVDSDVNVSVRPELAEAKLLRLTDAPTTWLGIVLNVMLCVSRLSMEKVTCCDPTLAVTLYCPPVLLAVSVGAVALPVALVLTVAEVAPPLKVALAPVVGVLNVTGTLARKVLETELGSPTVAVSGVSVAPISTV